MRKVQIEMLVPDDVDDGEVLTYAQDMAIEMAENAGITEELEGLGLAEAIGKITDAVSVETVGAG